MLVYTCPASHKILPLKSFARYHPSPNPARACISGGPFLDLEEPILVQTLSTKADQFYRHIELSAFKMAGDGLLQHSAGPA
jgi:hypothetical protein